MTAENAISTLEEFRTGIKRSMARTYCDAVLAFLGVSASAFDAAGLECVTHQNCTGVTFYMPNHEQTLRIEVVGSGAGIRATVVNEWNDRDFRRSYKLRFTVPPEGYLTVVDEILAAFQRELKGIGERMMPAILPLMDNRGGEGM